MCVAFIPYSIAETALPYLYSDSGNRVGTERVVLVKNHRIDNEWSGSNKTFLAE